MFFKEFPNWYYILIYCFQSNIFKIVFRCIFKLTSVCQNSVSDSNTKTVLLSEAVFFKEILKWFYFQIKCVQSHSFKIVFRSNIALAMSFKTLLLTVIPKRYYCQKQCFSKKYSNGCTFQFYCFQSRIFKIVFQSNIALTMSSKTMFLTVIPKRYYRQAAFFLDTLLVSPW